MRWFAERRRNALRRIGRRRHERPNLSSFENDPSGAGFVNYYDVRGKNQPPLGQLSGKLDGPEGMATDAKGTLYLANTITGNLLVYAPGATSPTQTLADVKGWVPGELALSSDRTIFAANIHGPLPKHCTSICPPKPGNIAVYPPGTSKPKRIYHTFPATQAYYPIGIALDRNGDIFVSYETINVSNAKASVVEFPAGSTTPKETGIVLGFAGGVAFDAKGNMLVGDLKCPCIDVFKPGSNSPSRRIVKSGTPVTFAFEKTGRYLYVANGANADLEEYDYATGKLVNRITGGGFTSKDQPTGIAVWPSLNAPKSPRAIQDNAVNKAGNFFVANENALVDSASTSLFAGSLRDGARELRPAFAGWERRPAAAPRRREVMDAPRDCERRSLVRFQSRIEHRQRILVSGREDGRNVVWL